MIFSILFSFKPKVFVLCQPVHPNLGDQAQLMCTDKWIKENYPGYKTVHLGYLLGTQNLYITKWNLIHVLSAYITLSVMKIKISGRDVFLGHSGYFMVDHHNGWKMFVDMMRFFPHNRMVILPQTVNFYTPYIKKYVSGCFAKNKNVTLLCRDEVSLSKAKELFPSTRLLLYPDIVTSLIGTRSYTKPREGVLFCMRDDIEAFYTPESIDALMAKFGGIRKEKVDTTLKDIPLEKMERERDGIINAMIEKIASYKVVITDRYHGTIFSAIASTPVIVISSADHKLSSGVKWFPKDVFGDAVQFAESLDDAYSKAQQILSQTNREYCNPPYFKEKYWDRLHGLLEA